MLYISGFSSCVLESTWDATQKTPKCTKQIVEYGTFSLISQFIQIFYISWYLWKALNEIEMFEIWKFLSGSLFIWKIFEMKFWSLHHFGIWVKR
jgi:hypothetical protein